MTENQFILLLNGFRNRRLSNEELRIFLEASADPRFESILGESLYKELLQMQAQPAADEERAQKVWSNIHASMRDAANSGTPLLNNTKAQRPIHRIHLLKTAWFRYAAAVIILFGTGAYLWNTQKEQPKQAVITSDIAPGREGAILTLADGTEYLLDSLADGILSIQKGTEITLKEGKLAYNAANADAVTYNTMRTPKGRQFNIQLPDGTRAWLNAASTITYPTAFIGPERQIKISGEVYLEVARDPKKPFKVEINNHTTVQVLGTSFNIKAYADDPGNATTLIEGAVRVTSFENATTLKPGQQMQVTNDGKINLVNKADISKITAWKNGLFNFKNESFLEVMKQLERWYDIDVKYLGPPPSQKFFGELQRDLTLAQVIEALREIGIQFEIDGRTLVVKQ